MCVKMCVRVRVREMVTVTVTVTVSSIEDGDRWEGGECLPLGGFAALRVEALIGGISTKECF